MATLGRMTQGLSQQGVGMAHILLIFVWMACTPKPTDTSEMTDVNPCQDGEILQSDGSCIPAGEPIERPSESEEESGGDTGQDTGSE